MTTAASNGAQARRDPFFARSGLVIAAVILLSFPLTYYIPLVTGTKTFSLLRHLHGLAFFAWTGLYVLQTQLAVRGHVRLHREVGLAGIALAGAMLPLGLWMAIAAIEGRIASGYPLPFEWAIYNLVDILVFSLLMAWAIFETRRRIDWHRRLAFIAILNLMGPAASRWFLEMPLPYPWLDMAPNLFADAALIVLALHDRRTLGKVHPITCLAAAVLVPIHIAEPFVALTAWWNGLAPSLFGFG